MKTYFRMIGYVELLCFAGALIWWLIDTIGGAYATRGQTIGISILILVILLFFGPAMGLLFLTAAKFLEEKEEKENTSPSSNKSYSDWEKDTKNRLDSLKEPTFNETKRYVDPAKNKFKDGDIAVLKRDITVNGSTVSKGEVGRVVRVDGADVIVLFNINGEEVNTRQSCDIFKTLEE